MTKNGHPQERSPRRAYLGDVDPGDVDPGEPVGTRQMALTLRFREPAGASPGPEFDGPSASTRLRFRSD